MERGSHYFARNIILTFHVYLAMLVIALVSALVFKFCNHYASPAEGFRNHNLLMTVHYKKLGFDNVLQEKRENLSYIFSTLATAGIIFLSLFWSNKYLLPRLAQRRESHIFLGMNLLFAISVAALIWFEPILRSQIILFPQAIELCVEPLVLLLALAIARLIIAYEVSAGVSQQRAAKLIFTTAAIAVSLFVVSYGIFDERSIAMEDYSLNFSPIAYPIIQQYFGKELLIDFKSLYGLHPYFMQLFLYIFPATILTLSLALAALFLISLLSLAFFIFSVVENKLLALSGFLALIFVQNFAINGRFFESGVTFQYESIRLLFPALLLSFLYFFCKAPSEKIYYFGLAFFSLATMWNLDTGIPTFLTLVLVLGYEKLKSKFKLKLALKHLAQSCGILALTWLTLILFLRIKYGQWPMLPWITYGQAATLDFAYAMLPIVKMGAWCSVLIIYAIGLALSINNFLTKQHSLQNSLMLAVTLLGVGLFTYFIGRSHISNIAHCGYPAVLLLIIFADKFCKNFVKKDLVYFPSQPRFDLLFLALPLLFIAYLSSVFLFEISSNKTLAEKFISTKFARESKPYWVQESDFIKQHINSDESFVREDILMLTTNDQDYYFDLELRAKSPLNVVNIRHMFYQKELDEVYDLIKSQEKKWVILVRPQNTDMTQILSDEEEQNLQKYLNKYYKINSQLQVSKDGGVTIFERKK